MTEDDSAVELTDRPHLSERVVVDWDRPPETGVASGSGVPHPHPEPREAAGE